MCRPSHWRSVASDGPGRSRSAARRTAPPRVSAARRQFRGRYRARAASERLPDADVEGDRIIVLARIQRHGNIGADRPDRRVVAKADAAGILDGFIETWEHVFGHRSSVEKGHDPVILQEPIAEFDAPFDQ